MRPVKPESLIPPRLNSTFSIPTHNLNPDEIYSHYQAKSKLDQRSYTIKILNIHSDFVKNHYDIAATLFIQELLRLNSLYPKEILIETFEISDKRMGFACLPYNSLEKQQANQQGEHDSKHSIDIGKMIRDVANDMEFLWKDLKLREFDKIISSKHIYQFEGGSNFFLGNWVKAVQNKALEKAGSKIDNYYKFQPSVLTQETIKSAHLAEEIFALGMTVLEINGVNSQIIGNLRTMLKVDHLLYDTEVATCVSQLDHAPVLLKETLTQMLSLDAQKLPPVEVLKNLRAEEEKSQENERSNIQRKAGTTSRPSGMNAHTH